MSTQLPVGQPEDPSRLTKVELRNRVSETVGAVGDLARATVKSSASQTLQNAITAFSASEKTIASTDEMLRKINTGMIDLEDALDEVAVSFRHAVNTPDPSTSSLIPQGGGSLPGESAAELTAPERGGAVDSEGPGEAALGAETRANEVEGSASSHASST